MLASPFKIARTRAFKRLQRLNVNFSFSLKGNILIFVGVRFHKWNRELNGEAVSNEAALPLKPLKAASSSLLLGMK